MCVQEKRAQMKDGPPNPFVKPGELQTFLAGLAQDFDNQLAKQTAALQEGFWARLRSWATSAFAPHLSRRRLERGLIRATSRLMSTRSI